MTKQDLNPPSEQGFLQDHFLQEGRTWTPISDHSKNIVKEQRNVELLELTRSSMKVRNTIETLVNHWIETERNSFLRDLTMLGYWRSFPVR